MQLTWKTSESASWLHAACCLASGYQPVDARLTAALAEPTDGLVTEIGMMGLRVPQALATITALAASGVENNRQLAEQSLVRALGRAKTSEAMVDRLTGRLSDLESRGQEFHHLTSDQTPLVEELALRSGPLQQQWEARGPGLLLTVGRLAEKDVVAEAASVVLVYPVLGGHGVAYLPANTITLEAVLANPHERIPEVVRLGWLLAQMNADLPKYADAVPAERLARTAALAMVPPTLAAAHYVELAPDDDRILGDAIVAWRLAEAKEAEPLAQVLNTWWGTYTDRPVPWDVALTALDQMLQG